MLSVALTGNVAAGKSTVAALFREWGATILDADQMVRELQAPGSPVLAAIAERFGAHLLLPDGSLDRPALRALVLRDEAALQALNGIVHPAVHARRDALLAGAQARGDRIVVSDIPLLFEASDPDAFDAVVLVDAPVAVRRRRLIETRGMDPAEADRLIAAQWPSEEKRERSDFIIDNAGDRSALERQARAVWRGLERLAARP
ncbi:MAG TPA: dephospho-CoA kinase [Gemmatimonadales bacterium]|nr:dephospho-CoA kinase [Gemmatimonadales bacterium]